ncbi:MAG: hypothetical protein ANIMEMIM_00154 [Candidatus Argoarchaeum ethanivorans]|uniref:Uncharacterized protein n=1 Tax=Candidatus Argoarchaeum ethanivorans TaxID=2608793 RepID=A0A811T317_9EURY|nr:MAG: hypothetical protein ANIMEMIM_00154 [Candidatus Argoarchaeum ethanivorans]
MTDATSTYDCTATAISTQPDPALEGAGTVDYSMTVTDNNGGDTVPAGTWTAVVNFSTGNQTDPLTAGTPSGLTRPITGNGSVPANTPAGNYIVTFKLNGTEVCNDTVTVNEVLSVTAQNMTYSDVNPGANTSSSHALNNTGNVPIYFKYGTTTGYNNDIGDEGIKWGNMTGPETITKDNIVTSWLNTTQIAINANANAGFTLNVPQGTATGAYAGSTTFTPNKVV